MPPKSPFSLRHYRMERDPATGEKFVRIPFTGVALLRDPMYNKSTAFTPEERRRFGLQGLMPPHVATMEEQLRRVYENYQRKESDLERYLHLMSLHDRNQTLFFRLLLDHLEEMMPIIYTPTVGLACQMFSHIYRRPRGLYLSLADKDRMTEVLSNAPFSDVRIVVVTDNERILGLGDLGVGGMGIPMGKLALYTAAAGIHPSQCLPIDLDVGTDNEELRNDPLYLGARHPRLRGREYYDFVEVFVEGLRRAFPQAILQWEDFKKDNAFTLLERYRGRLASFNDDIQGTGAVVLAGVLVAARAAGRPLRETRFLIHGAGAAGVGIARMLAAGLRGEGLSETEARARIFMADSRGLVLSDRDDLEEYKKPFAHAPRDAAAHGLPADGRVPLEELVRRLKPQVLVGVSGQRGCFTKVVLEAMAENAERPVIFALSNPTANSETTPHEVYEATKGRAFVATGSPFAPVRYGGKTYPLAQGNNVFIFPGVGLGAMVAGARELPDSLFAAAAKALAEEVTEARIARGCLYPEISDIRRVSRSVALAAARKAVEEGVAALLPGADVEALVDAAIWEPLYCEYRYDPGAD